MTDDVLGYAIWNREREFFAYDTEVEDGKRNNQKHLFETRQEARNVIDKQVEAGADRDEYGIVIVSPEYALVAVDNDDGDLLMSGDASLSIDDDALAVQMHGDDLT